MPSKTKLILAIVILPLVVLSLSAVLLRTNAPKTPLPTYTYNDQQSDTLLKTLKNRPPLATNDARIRSRLVTNAKDQAGLIVTSPYYRISYLEPFDLFEVEIVSRDITTAHTQATQWFLQKGLSQEALCNLPVSFFINEKIPGQSPNKTVEVNPLPDGC